VSAVAREGRVDLEAVEQALRAAVLEAGAKVLGRLLESVGVGRRKTRVLCPRCRALMESNGVQSKDVVTLLGWIRFARSRFVCPKCGATLFPGDAALGIVNTSRSPGVQRLEARFGAKETFKEVAEDLHCAAGIEVSAKDAERVAEAIGEAVEQWGQRERWEQRRADAGETEGPPLETLYVEFDGTGVPMVPKELAGRKGKQPDGSAKTREAKLGCVFTQTLFDDEGRPLRDRASMSFVGAIENAERFGSRVYDEAQRRGLYRARRVATLSDGAEWAKSLADTQFPNAVHIIDFYHAAEHVARLAKLLYERNPKLLETQIERWTTELYEGRVQTVIDQASALLPKDLNAMKDARKEIAYLVKNKDRMRYDQYRAQHLFIGSGVVEAGCKHLIGHRLKQSGMEWTVRGANAIIALRCAILSNRFEDFWQQRLAESA
jgi:predicted CoA-binding protein